MPTFTWVPDQDPERAVEARVLSASFGDGYEQRLRDGLNSMPETWTLEFTTRTSTEIRAIEDFLEALAGVSNFDWVTPRGDTKKFTCKAWKSRYRHVRENSLSCTFKQDFAFA